MNIPPGSSRDIRIIFLILGVYLVVAGCQEDTPSPTCPDYAVGALEGYTLSVGQPVSLDIRARGIDESGWGEIAAETSTDSTGYYRFDLPSGLYRLEVNLGDGFSFDYEERDTVRVRQTVRRYDLWRGRVEVQVGVPDVFEGEEGSLRLYGESNSETMHAYVQSGQLHFVFPFQSLGSYKMLLSLANQSQFFLPDTYVRSEGQSLDVGKDEVARYEVDFSETYATISGVVTGSWLLAGQSPMEVTLYSSSPYNNAGRGSCDDDGAFTCGVLVPGPHKMKTNYGYYIDQWVGGVSFETAQVFDVQPGDEITGITVVESGIAVRVEWPGDLIGSTPPITIRDENDLEQSVSGPGGNPYYLCNLSPGRYYVQVGQHCDDKTWVPQWFGGTGNFEDAEPIDLVAGELREISVTLVEGGRIEGEVRDQDGLVPVYAQYLLFDTDGVSLCNYWKSWPSDRMHFTGVPDGTCLVAARDPDSQSWYHPGTYDIAEATRIVIENHQTVSGLIWTLPEDAKGGTP